MHIPSSLVPSHWSSHLTRVVYNLIGSLGKIESLTHSRPENQKGGIYGAQEAWKKTMFMAQWVGETPRVSPSVMAEE